MVSANGVYRLSVVGTVLGQQHVHTLHFRSTANPTVQGMSEQSYMQAIIDEWQQYCRTTYRLRFTTGQLPVQLLSMRKVCGSVPLPAGVDEGEATGNQAGTYVESSEGMAPWLAQVTTLRTGFAGRSFRGRFFLGGMHEGWVVGATIAGSISQLVRDYCDTLFARFVTPDEVNAQGKLFVFSRKLAGTAGIQCQNAGADVRSYLVRDQLASMKSRRAGSGI